MGIFLTYKFLNNIIYKNSPTNAQGCIQKDAYCSIICKGEIRSRQQCIYNSVWNIMYSYTVTEEYSVDTDMKDKKSKGGFCFLNHKSLPCVSFSNKQVLHS